jgi:hypothetical protein
MNRREFQWLALGSVINTSAFARKPRPTPVPVPAFPPIDALNRIKALRITTGPLANGYLIAPNGRLNWYFTNLGLMSIVQYLTPAELDTYIRTYLDLYMSRIENNYAIQDVNFNDATLQNITLVPSDSDNSYAATLLTLVTRYLKASSNWAWWDLHKAKLKNIIYANIATVQKPNGLCRVFQLPRTSPVSDYGYLMNNIEDYRGLRDYASILMQRGETVDANYYNNIATTITQSIIIYLWDSARSGFRVSDQDARADTTSFYPGATCQIFPQAFSVPELSSYFTQGYQFLNTYKPLWTSEAYDAYPWTILGYVAAKRGDTARAQLQMLATDKKFASNPEYLTINELGFYQRTRSILNGFGDI